MSTVTNVNEAIEKLESKFKNYCKRRWNGNGEEVSQTSYLTFSEKINNGEFEHRSDAQTQDWLQKTARKTARKVIGYKATRVDEANPIEYQISGWKYAVEGSEVDLDELIASGREPIDFKKDEVKTDYRVDDAVVLMSANLKLAVNLIRDGYDFSAAAKKIGLSASALSQSFRAIGDKIKGSSVCKTPSDPSQQGLWEVAA